ncbi:MAG: dUTP diphosphatase [Deltaproteobacteria bacterium]|nr:dUTP diphosphatase [Deltaproteobacteria bacterium]
MKPTIKFLRLNAEADKDIDLPKYMTPLSAGMDIRAAVKKSLTLKPQDIALLPTGFAIAIPEGFEAQIRPRSGLAVKYGITIINSPGTIDADYRGEVKIAVINLGKAEYTINRGDRIAQMVIKRVYQADIQQTDKLDSTKRDAGGFGHTGV